MTDTTTNIYLELHAIARLLHNVFLDYPTVDSIQYFNDNQLDKNWPVLIGSEANQKGKVLLSQFISQWQPDQINEVKLDYGQLYFGPGEPNAMPWGSVYLGEQQILNDQSTIQLMSFYKKFGISFDLKYNQPIDHISLFYSVIDQLLQQLLDEPNNKLAKEALIILLQQHMLPWSGRCHELAIEYAQTDFYKAIALLSQDFESVLASTMNVVPMPMRLFR
ncbi:molecular chaperone TorD family protein [Shewanella sp. BF02_Schw]|uniref:TorD/DmsD family molecular chaperone n=1 Tax=Shewanella sp. BF02_Schw TaxID=394908 RepID=UPI00177AF661|nr:molecular chaperone TorD family protein [Shewanella sp. BF02_Schw]MBO1897311.1 molecular chaperone TorD family protein [Shewanella sp. BF02_Schw]